MKTKIVRIGNSKGIRIPKSILTQCGFDEGVELDVRDGELIIRSSVQIRAGWETQFKRMAQSDDDKLLDANFMSDWDQDEWEWD